jgi:hypothetical protein
MGRRLRDQLLVQPAAMHGAVHLFYTVEDAFDVVLERTKDENPAPNLALTRSRTAP